MNDTSVNKNTKVNQVSSRTHFVRAGINLIDFFVGDSQMKTCSKCKETKPMSEFYKDRSKKDGLRSWCKSCFKRYRKSEKSKACDKAYKQSENGKATMKQFNARHPNYRKAMQAVNNAVAAGRLPRPDTLLCSYCPKPAQQYHHHKGYELEHWLDVVPVCLECHRTIHKKIA